MSHLRITDPDGFRLTIGPKIAGRTPNPDRIDLLVDGPEGDGIAVDLSPLDASEVAHTLAVWAERRGFPTSPWPSNRWVLLDPDVLAVLIERVVTGEEPTAENVERFTQAYREAHLIAHALPSVLGLLEELNLIVDADVIEETGDSGWESAADLAEALRLTAEWSMALALPGWSWFDALNRYPDRLGFDPIPASGRPCGVIGEARLTAPVRPSEVPHCAGRATNPHERVAMERGRSGWTCPFCGDVTAPDGPVTYPKVDDLRAVLDALDHVYRAEGWTPRAALADAAGRLRHAVDVAARFAMDATATVVPDVDPEGLIDDLALVVGWFWREEANGAMAGREDAGRVLAAIRSLADRVGLR